MTEILSYAKGFFAQRKFNYTGNVYISFSGGRSSAAMLRLLLDLHGRKLPENWIVVSTNTGKEDEATYKFIHDVETNWDVPVVSLELTKINSSTDIYGVEIKQVDYETAARNGEPFEVVLAQSPDFLPHRSARTCTRFMKVRTSLVYAHEWLGWEKWTALLGYRADEYRRLHRTRMTCGKEKFPYEPDAPLTHAGIVKADVLDFFKKHPFDLQLSENRGNCTMCFLKAERYLRGAYREDPQSIWWWINIEERAGKTMFPGGYKGLRERILADLPPAEADDLQELECNCTD